MNDQLHDSNLRLFAQNDALKRKNIQLLMVYVNGRGVLRSPPPSEHSKFRFKTQDIQYISTVVEWGNKPFSDAGFGSKVKNCDC